VCVLEGHKAIMWGSTAILSTAQSVEGCDNSEHANVCGVCVCVCICVRASNILECMYVCVCVCACACLHVRKFKCACVFACACALFPACGVL